MKANESFQKEDYSQAYKYYTECLALGPGLKSYSSIVYVQRATGIFIICEFRVKFISGQVLLKMSRFDEALLDADTAVELNANSAKAYSLRGEIKVGLRKFEDAARDFKRAQQLNPGT